jgi:hypothetical protein
VCVCVCVCVCVHVRIASHVASVFTATCSGRVAGRHTSSAPRLNYYYNCILLQPYSDLSWRLQGRSLKNINQNQIKCLRFNQIATTKITPYITHNLLRQVLEVLQDGLPVVKECVCGITVRVVGNPGQITNSSKRHILGRCLLVKIQ